MPSSSPHPHADVVRKAVIGHTDSHSPKPAGTAAAPTPPPGPPPGWSGAPPVNGGSGGSWPRSPDIENVRPYAHNPPVEAGSDDDDEEDGERPLFHATPGAASPPFASPPFTTGGGFTPLSAFSSHGGHCGNDNGDEPSFGADPPADPLAAAGAFRTGAESAASSMDLYNPHDDRHDDCHDGEDDDDGGGDDDDKDDRHGDDNGGGGDENSGDGDENGGAGARSLLVEESMDDDETDNSVPNLAGNFSSPFKPSAAEQEYEEMLLSPAQRNRIANKRRRQVFVAVRVRPFLPHEVPQGAEPGSSDEGDKRGVLAVRGSKLLLVNPAVFPGASGELVADMVRSRMAWAVREKK
jgi:hypothetical protein